MATLPGTPIIDSRTKRQVGVTGAIPGAIYQNGVIIGYQNDYLQPQVTATGLAPKTNQPGSTPFISRQAVEGVEAVRGLPYGTESTNRTTPLTGAQAAAAGTPFDPQAYIDQQLQAYLESIKPKAPSTPEEIQKWIYDHYGYMAAYINHPEIGHILQEAARLEITSEAQLFGMLSATDWWKTTSEVARKWDYLVNTDPAEAQRQRDMRAAEITNKAGALGIGMDGDIGGFVEQAMRMGWSDEQITDYLIDRVKTETSFVGGSLGSLQNDIREAASRYLIDISDETSSFYARRIASGEMTIEGASSVFAQQARARFPWMAQNIDAGVTPGDYFLPMRDQIARQLEVSPDDIDPMDPKWLDMMEGTDAKTGDKRGATQYEILRKIRGMGDYYKTGGAQSLYAQLATGIGQRLGAF